MFSISATAVICPMKIKPKGPFIPPPSHDTVRQGIMHALVKGPCSAKDLSAAVKIPEHETYEHLEHIRRTLTSSGGHLGVTPAECKKCGFIFSKRERLKKPGKCPVCRGEAIRDPLFKIDTTA